MFDEKKSLEMLEGFQNHYNYDTTYMKEMLKANPKAYETFENFLPMASFKDKAPVDVIFVAKLTSMKNEDCGKCLQLNVDMALEAGVDKEVVKEVVFNQGENLSTALKEIYDFTLAVSNNEQIPNTLYDKIHKKYSKEVLTEIALAIASTKIFPTVKRVFNDFHSCSVIQLKV
jgi:alkylhydroperoxidase/carboxymuconolactone decarboxylase family protein YurZ